VIVVKDIKAKKPIEVSIRFEGQMAIVLSPGLSNDVLGILDSSTSLTLSAIQKTFNVAYNAFLCFEMRDPQTLKIRKEPWIQVVIYGCATESEEIGDVLYKNYATFLQTPEIYDECFPYKNPQVYDIFHGENPTPAPEVVVAPSSAKKATKLHTVKESTTNGIWNLFDATEAFNEVSDIDLSGLLKTELKEYVTL
jgi:hypothetical protein